MSTPPHDEKYRDENMDAANLAARAVEEQFWDAYYDKHVSHPYDTHFDHVPTAVPTHIGCPAVHARSETEPEEQYEYDLDFAEVYARIVEEPEFESELELRSIPIDTMWYPDPEEHDPSVHAPHHARSSIDSSFFDDAHPAHLLDILQRRSTGGSGSMSRLKGHSPAVERAYARSVPDMDHLDDHAPATELVHDEEYSPLVVRSIEEMSLDTEEWHSFMEQAAADMDLEDEGETSTLQARDVEVDYEWYGAHMAPNAEFHHGLHGHHVRNANPEAYADVEAWAEAEANDLASQMASLHANNFAHHGGAPHSLPTSKPTVVPTGRFYRPSHWAHPSSTTLHTNPTQGPTAALPYASKIPVFARQAPPAPAKTRSRAISAKASKTPASYTLSDMIKNAFSKLKPNGVEGTEDMEEAFGMRHARSVEGGEKRKAAFEVTHKEKGDAKPAAGVKEEKVSETRIYSN